MRKPSRFPMIVLVVLMGIGSWAWFYFQGSYDVVEAGVDDSGVAHVGVLHTADATDASSMAVESVERETLDALEVANLGERDAVVAVVHVELTLKQGEGGHPPPSCRGWEVQVQYRSGLEPSVSTLSRTVDANGAVDLPFEDAIQVERITCIPPLNSGWSFAVSTPRRGTTVLPGQTHTALLNFSRAQSASGRVVDHHGEAVAQASVHVFPRKHNPGLRHWTEGILSTTTDADGNFHFEQMPQGAWSFAVKPTQWLMFDPGLGDQSEGHGLLFFYGESDDATDVGTLGVVPMTMVELSLVGSQGAPAAFHNFYLSPVRFDDPHIKASEEDDFQSLQDVLLPYPNYAYRTDIHGKASLRLVHGDWDLRIAGAFGTDTYASYLPLFRFSTQEKNVRYTLETPLGLISGQVRTSEGLPLAGARAYLLNNFRKISAAKTKGDGWFRLPSAKNKMEATLRVVPNNKLLLPGSWKLQESDWDQAFDAVLQESSSLELRFVDFQGLPLAPANLTLRLVEWNPRLAKNRQEFPDWWNETSKVLHVLSSNRPTKIHGLFPGSYGVALFYHPDRLDPITGLRPAAYELRRWTLDTGEAVHELQVSIPR